MTAVSKGGDLTDSVLARRYCDAYMAVEGVALGDARARDSILNGLAPGACMYACLHTCIHRYKHRYIHIYIRLDGWDDCPAYWGGIVGSIGEVGRQGSQLSIR